MKFGWDGKMANMYSFALAHQCRINFQKKKKVKKMSIAIKIAKPTIFMIPR